MKWILKHKEKIDSGNPKDVANVIIKNRNLKKSDFLLNKFGDPYIFPQMNVFVERIIKAASNQERVVIHGDYDVDGITASSILYLYFKNVLKIENVEIYLPSRYVDGYGVSINAIDKFIKDKVDLLITVDCGIKDIASIEKAKKNNIDVIVSDHHTFAEYPPALAVIHPHDYLYSLCGAGVALKMVQALDIKLKKRYSEELIDLAGLGTICDVMELTGENRYIVQRALNKLRDNKRIGLEKLFEVIELDKTLIETYHIGFVIGPRLNASGRLQSAYASLNLLITDNEDDAFKYASNLNELNKNRQEETLLAVNSALLQVNKDKYINILYIPNISIGVVGLVSSRITDQTGKPSIIFTNNEEDIYVGSARSIDELNIMDLLNPNSKFFVSFGGHKKAAGMKVKKENFEKMKKSLEKLSNELLKNFALEKTIKVDLSLEIESFDLGKLYNMIKQFEPFGEGNSRPVFMSEKKKISNIFYMGENGKHIKLTLDKIEAVGFNMGDKVLSVGQYVDIVYNINRNYWNNTEKFQLNIIDIKVEE